MYCIPIVHYVHKTAKEMPLLRRETFCSAFVTLHHFLSRSFRFILCRDTAQRKHAEHITSHNEGRDGRTGGAGGEAGACFPPWRNSGAHCRATGRHEP